MKNKKAKGFSKTSGRHVEGIIYQVYANGVGILTENGIALVENGEYELIETEEEKCTLRTVHMGFNSNDEGKVEEFVSIVEQEGACKASWGVTGRTMHMILAEQLADSLPQYEWELDYNLYTCKATKRKDDTQ